RSSTPDVGHYRCSGLAVTDRAPHTHRVPMHRKAKAAVDAVIDEVGSSLAMSGWRRRNLNMLLSFWETFTLDIGGGVLATLEIEHLWSGGPADTEWPASVRFDLGVGLEPALGLMPLLSLVPNATLIRRDRGRRDRRVTLANELAVPEVAAQICAFVG